MYGVTPENNFDSTKSASWIVCTTPADLTGYTVTETELSTATGFSVAAACADNYEGAAVVTPCTTDGPYALAGCESIVCTTPANLSGYRILSEYNLDLSDGAFDVTAACGKQGCPVQRRRTHEQQ